MVSWFTQCWRRCFLGATPLLLGAFLAAPALVPNSEGAAVGAYEESQVFGGCDVNLITSATVCDDDCGTSRVQNIGSGETGNSREDKNCKNSSDCTYSGLSDDNCTS